MSYGANDIHDIHNFDITMDDLIKNAEEEALIGIDISSSSKEYNLKIIEEYLEKHPNISLSYDRYHDLTKKHELYFSVK